MKLLSAVIPLLLMATGVFAGELEVPDIDLEDYNAVAGAVLGGVGVIWGIRKAIGLLSGRQESFRVHSLFSSYNYNIMEFYNGLVIELWTLYLIFFIGVWSIKVVLRLLNEWAKQDKQRIIFCINFY